MKWQTKLTLENDSYIEEFEFVSDSKRDSNSTFQILSNRYNGLDYSATHIEDYVGNIIAKLKRRDKAVLNEADYIPLAIATFGLFATIWFILEVTKSW